MGKYSREYLTTRNIKSFINLVLKHYPNIKEASAKRRYYDERKEHGEQQPIYSPEEKRKPSILKMYDVDDMKRYKMKITRQVLEKYGFSRYEINWLEDEGYIDRRYE